MLVDQSKPTEISQEEQRLAEKFAREHGGDIKMSQEEWDTFANLSRNGLIINSSKDGVVVNKVQS